MLGLRIFGMVSLAVLVACGGSGDSRLDRVDTPLMEDEVGDEFAMAPSIFDVSTPGIDQIEGIYSFERYIPGWFDEANISTLIVPQGTSADYKGGFQVGVGDEEAYLSGDLFLRFDLVNETANGWVDSLNYSGNDVENRFLSQLASLDVIIPSVDGSGFSGTIKGTYRDRVSEDQTTEFGDFSLNSSVDGRFVEGEFFDTMLGVVSGTLTQPDATEKPIFGVIVGDESP
ncbi:MAG: hypothetical protein AAFQ64_13050 [Pseudomonadota bacterium]